MNGFVGETALPRLAELPVTVAPDSSKPAEMLAAHIAATVKSLVG